MAEQEFGAGPRLGADLVFDAAQHDGRGQVDELGTRQRQDCVAGGGGTADHEISDPFVKYTDVEGRVEGVKTPEIAELDRVDSRHLQVGVGLVRPGQQFAGSPGVVSAHVAVNIEQVALLPGPRVAGTEGVGGAGLPVDEGPRDELRRHVAVLLEQAAEVERPVGRDAPVEVGKGPVQVHGRWVAAGKQEGRGGLVAPALQAPHQPGLRIEGEAVLQFDVGPVGRSIAVQGNVGVTESGRQPAVDAEFVVAVKADQPLLVVGNRAAPSEVDGAALAGCGALGIVAEGRVRVALVALDMVVARAQGEFVTGVDAVIAAQAEGLAVARVAHAGESVVAGLGGGEAHAESVAASGPAGMGIGDAMIADVDLARGAPVLVAVAGDDVDHAKKGVGPVGVGVGAADNLDALDFLDREGQGRPVDAAKTAGGIYRAPIDQHLDFSRIVAAESVVGDPLAVSALLADLHARNQPEQAGNIPVAGGADELAVEDGDGARCFVERLGQARGRQDGRQLFEKRHFGPRSAQGVGGKGKLQRQRTREGGEQGPLVRQQRHRVILLISGTGGLPDTSFPRFFSDYIQPTRDGLRNLAA